MLVRSNQIELTPGILALTILGTLLSWMILQMMRRFHGCYSVQTICAMWLLAGRKCGTLSTTTRRLQGTTWTGDDGEPFHSCSSSPPGIQLGELLLPGTSSIYSVIMVTIDEIMLQQEQHCHIVPRRNSNFRHRPRLLALILSKSRARTF